MQKSKLFFILILLHFNFFSAVGQSLPVEKRDYLLDDNIRQLYPNESISSNIISAIDSVQTFLVTKNLADVNGDSSLARQIVKFIQYPLPNFIKYEIVSIDEVSKVRIVLLVNSYLSFPQEKANVKEFQGSFKIAYNINEKKIVFPVINESYKKYSYPKIEFYIHHQVTTSKDILKRSNRYLTKLDKLLRLKYPAFISPQKKLNYFIAAVPFKGLEYWSLYSYIFTSRYIRDISSIVDVKSEGLYRHELIHYLLSEYKLSDIINEGMATYLSGGESVYGISPKLQWKHIIEKFHMDSASAINSTVDSLWFSDHPREMYLVSALLLYTYNQKVGDEIFYRTIFERLSTYTQKEILDFFATELQIKRLSEFILSTKPDIWETISQKKKGGS